MAAAGDVDGIRDCFDPALLGAILRHVRSTSAELIHEVHAAFNRGDLDAFLDAWDADCEYRPAAEAMVEGGAVYRGHDGVRSWWRRMRDEWQDFHVEADEIRDLGDRFVVFGHVRGRGRASGVSTESPLVQIVMLRDSAAP